MRTTANSFLRGLFLVLLLFSAGAASAQDSRSIRIDDGEVYIDGRLVHANELPASLDARDMQVQYIFSGDVEPVIRIGEQYFVLEGNRLREAEPEERNDVSVFFRESLPDRVQLSAEAAQIARDEADAMSAYVTPHTALLQRKAAELQQQAERLQAFQVNGRNPIESERIEELERAAQALTLQAEEAARAAEAMPRLQVQGYLNKVQQRDRGLFNRLVDEREMERETMLLAEEIRRMEDGEARTEKIEELRSKLDEIFDLKQDNRRQEIEQLEERLEDLQEKLVERERMREDIVERRLRELLHMKDEMNW